MVQLDSKHENHPQNLRFSQFFSITLISSLSCMALHIIQFTDYDLRLVTNDDGFKVQKEVKYSLNVNKHL